MFDEFLKALDARIDWTASVAYARIDTMVILQEMWHEDQIAFREEARSA